jgi:glucose/arabinose dehydrogenase
MKRKSFDAAFQSQSRAEPRIFSMLLLSLFLFGCGAAFRPGDPRLDQIRLPPGFKIEVFAPNVPGARSLALGERGTLFIGTRDRGKVYAIPNAVRPASGPRKVLTIAGGLHMPNGVAFRDGSLYVAEVSRILRYDRIESSLGSPPAPVVVTDRLPTNETHGWKFIRFGPDGLLYVPIGAPCNICEHPDPYASITRMKPDGSDMEIFARGIRNTVGFDWDPATGELWFTDNGRDWLGDNQPPDELNKAPQPGLHFGYPYVHSGYIHDPELGQNKDLSLFTPPAILLGPHVAALGMRFYTGGMFPAEYRNQIFIAEHGSWNRTTPIGYRVSLVKVSGGKAISYQPFAEGWLVNGTAWGRPVDVQVMPDGALLVSDDAAGAIYRISYSGG